MRFAPHNNNNLALRLARVRTSGQTVAGPFHSTTMKEIELLHLKAIRKASELVSTLQRLRTLAFDEATRDTQENIAHITESAETLHQELTENPILLPTTLPWGNRAIAK